MSRPLKRRAALYAHCLLPRKNSIISILSIVYSSDTETLLCVNLLINKYRIILIFTSPDLVYYIKRGIYRFLLHLWFFILSGNIFQSIQLFYYYLFEVKSFLILNLNNFRNKLKIHSLKLGTALKKIERPLTRGTTRPPFHIEILAVKSTLNKGLQIETKLFIR